MFKEFPKLVTARKIKLLNGNVTTDASGKRLTHYCKTCDKFFRWVPQTRPRDPPQTYPVRLDIATAYAPAFNADAAYDVATHNSQHAADLPAFPSGYGFKVRVHAFALVRQCLCVRLRLPACVWCVTSIVEVYSAMQLAKADRLLWCPRHTLCAAQTHPYNRTMFARFAPKRNDGPALAATVAAATAAATAATAGKAPP
jgi:hypothetical protein